jgi:hypothetical protein
VDKLDGYFAWAKQEKRIAGFNPWVRLPAALRSAFLHGGLIGGGDGC